MPAFAYVRVGRSPNGLTQLDGRLAAPDYGKEAMALSRDHRIVDTRAGPATRGDQILLDEIPADDAPEPAAANQWAIDGIETSPARASVPSGIDGADTMIHNGWFG